MSNVNGLTSSTHALKPIRSMHLIFRSSHIWKRIALQNYLSCEGGSHLNYLKLYILFSTKSMKNML